MPSGVIGFLLSGREWSLPAERVANMDRQPQTNYAALYWFWYAAANGGKVTKLISGQHEMVSQAFIACGRRCAATRDPWMPGVPVSA